MVVAETLADDQVSVGEVVVVVVETAWEATVAAVLVDVAVVAAVAVLVVEVVAAAVAVPVAEVVAAVVADAVVEAVVQKVQRIPRRLLLHSLVLCHKCPQS